MLIAIVCTQLAKNECVRERERDEEGRRESEKKI